MVRLPPPERFSRSNRPGYPHPVCSELENSDISDCSVNGVRKTVHVHAKKHYKHNEDGRTAPGMRCHGSVPLSYSGTSLRELDYNNKNDERNQLFVKVGSLPSFIANIASHEITSIIHVVHNIGLVGRLFWV